MIDGGGRKIEGAARGEAPIAVFVHVHYPEIWREMSDLLATRLTVPFHLIVTTSHAEDQIVIPETRHLRSARILPVANRGRDILPFLEALAATEHFELGLKLHTKKSPQRTDGAEWRGEILDSLVPRRGARLRTIIRRLQADKRIGFVTPAGFCLSVKPWVLVNAPGMVTVMRTLGAGLTESDLDDTYFAAGSMFWFRRPALAALADPRVRALFEPEEGQFDGTIAHAMERLFPVEARRQNFLSLAMPALMASRPAMALPQLLDLVRRHADVPSTYFPAPYVAALAVRPRSRRRMAALLQRVGDASIDLRLTLSQWRGPVIRR
jgi:lipopolysaccharide biosynthesis protein